MSHSNNVTKTREIEYVRRVTMKTSRRISAYPPTLKENAALCFEKNIPNAIKVV